jgi:hypothetical protein
MSQKIFDPTPPKQRIASQYFSWNDGKPRLITCTCEYYYLTKLEAFLLKCGLLSIKSIDRRETRIAKFNKIRSVITNKIKKKKTVYPFLWKDPRTNNPILFTSMGVVYKLSYLDRLMLKLGKTNAIELNKKAVGRIITYQILEDSYTSYANYPGYLQYTDQDS